MADTKYLKQRHQTWYVRVRVPPSLKATLGYELSLTTGTRDLKTAQQRRWAIVAAMKERIATAQARVVLGESDVQWLVNEAKALSRDVREGRVDQDMALEVGLHDILERHFKAAAYPIDPETGHPMIESQATQAAVEAASRVVSAGDVLLMSDAVDTYLHEIEDRITKATWQKKHRMLGGLREFLKDPEVSTITRQMCGEYLTAKLMKSGIAVRTIKDTLTHLSAFFVWSEGRGLIQLNPISGLSRTVREPKRGNGTKVRRPWTVKELEKLFESYDKSLPVWQVTALGLYTGMRIEELCQLTVEDVSKAALQVTAGKTDAAVREVPIHPTIRDLVSSLKKNSEDGYLISGLHPGGYDGKRSAAMTKRFGRLKRELGFDDPAVVFHSLRASFIRALAEAEVPKSTQRLLVGHADGDITDSYAGGLSLKKKIEAVERINFGKVDASVQP